MTVSRDRNSATPRRQPPIRVGLLLVQGFSMICVATMINPFRSANRHLGWTAYSWHFISHDGRPVTASDGISIAAETAVDRPVGYHYFFVTAGLEFDPPYRARLNAALRRQKPLCQVMGGLCTGAFILARAGLLNGYEFTLHWENQPAFAEEFPDLPISPRLYVLDRDRWTGSGGVTSMDIALHVIRTHHGDEVAEAVANQYLIDRARSPLVDQRPDHLKEFDTLPTKVQTAIRLMQATIETPLSNAELAQRLGTTARTLERLFQRHLGESPSAFSRHIRVARARQLIWHTNISLLEIALMTGFSSPSYLSRIYQSHYGVLPSRERRRKS